MSRLARDLTSQFYEYADDTQVGVEEALELAMLRCQQKVQREHAPSVDPQLQSAYDKVKQQNLKLKQELEQIKTGLATLERQKKEAQSKRFVLDNADLAQDDVKLKQAYGFLSRAKEELHRLRNLVEQSKLNDIVQLENEVLYLKKQLKELKQESRSIRGSSDHQTAALEQFRNSQSFETKQEALQRDLTAERSRLAELKAHLLQMQNADKQRQDRYAELDLGVRVLNKAIEENAPPKVEVRLKEATKQVDIMEKATKTQSTVADRSITEAEERLRTLIMETNKSSAIVNERAQQIKLKDLKIRELQAKVTQLQPRAEIYANPEAKSKGPVTEYIQSLSPQKTTAKSLPKKSVDASTGQRGGPWS